jgi:hypothetical protein
MEKVKDNDFWDKPADLSGFTIEEIKVRYALYILIIEQGCIPKMDYVNQYASEHSMEYLQNKIANIKNGKTPVEMVRKMLDAINNRIQ